MGREFVETTAVAGFVLGHGQEMSELGKGGREGICVLLNPENIAST